MPRFCANLTMLYGEHEFLDRFEAAARSGFRGVEYLFPYAYAARELVDRLHAFDLVQVLHNLPAGDWAKGERGIAALPGRVAEFREGVDRAVEYATALGCRQVNCLAGIVPPAIAPERARATLVENLGFAAEKLERAGIKLLVEPINTFDMPGFFLNRTAQALELVREVGSDNLFVQYDVYHMQRMEGELGGTLRAHLTKIAHIQIADNPGRNEPGTGEINYPFVFALLDQLGYAGWIGCEYKPAGKTAEGLGWFAPYRDAR